MRRPAQLQTHRPAETTLIKQLTLEAPRRAHAVSALAGHLLAHWQ